MKLQVTISAILFAALLPFGQGAGLARAQLGEPLRVGNMNPLKDVFGRNLDGPSCAQPSRVDIFRVELRKPAVLLTNTFVGANSMPHQGFFSTAISERPAPDTILRAVVYDASTSNEASFFCSATATTPATGNLLFDFGQPMPMARFGSDAEAAREDAIERQFSPDEDFDNDGMSDYAEAVARTDIENSRSLLAFAAIEASPQVVSREIADGNTFKVVLKWQAVAGVTYRLQYAPSLVPDGEVVWEDILDPIMCTASVLESGAGEDADITYITCDVLIPNEDFYLQGHFRILVDH